MASSPAPEPSYRRKSVQQMNSAERLASLKEWAEEKKYVRPGESGTISVNGVAGINALVYGGPVQTTSNSRNSDKYAGQYDAPIGPPSYRVATNEQPRERSKSKLGRWWEARKAKKSAPPYTP